MATKSEYHTVSPAEQQKEHKHTQVQGQCHKGKVPRRAKGVGGRQEGASAQTGVLRLSLQGGLMVSQREEGGVTMQEGGGRAARGEVHSLCPEKSSAARLRHELEEGGVSSRMDR